MPRGPEERELEQLKRRRQRAQDNCDIPEEAKICNAIGELYTQSGDYRRALHYHRIELSLSEATGDQLGAAIAHRRVGECECEVGNYGPAIEHQTMHLKIAQQLGHSVEEQRALATLGRTYLMQSEEEEGEGEEERGRESLLKAGSAFLKSLDVCDKLVGNVSEREVLEMRSRLYLNLGLVYENQADLSSARKFMEKALNIVKELGDSATVFRCHFGLGSLHLRERHPAMAVSCFREALAVARGPENKADVLKEMAQAYLLMPKFEEAKSCLKKVLGLLESSQRGMEQVQRQLRAVRKILHLSSEVDGVCVGRVSERMQLYDKLGDLCCLVKAYPAAIKFYAHQLDLAEAHGLEPQELSPIYCSLARTHVDCGQYSQALLHYQRELELWRGNPCEECDTLINIAKVRESAGHERTAVMEVYHQAAELAQRPQQKVGVYRAVLHYLRTLPLEDGGGEVSRWEEQLSRLLLDCPEAGATPSSDSGSEDIGDSEPPPSLPSAEESEEDDECAVVVPPRLPTGVAVRKKSRVNRRNDKGETLLHIAAIENNLTAVRQLIKEGADVNACDHCGWIPLHEACNHGHLDVARCLIEGGAVVNNQGGPHCDKVTPLIDAATNGHLDIVRLLVECGADVRMRDAHGRTALAVVEERLSSVAEVGQGYNLVEEYRSIKDFLRGKMGVGGGERRLLATGERGGSHRRKEFDRTGGGVLYTSDEEEVVVPAQQRSRHDNPFQSFTVATSDSSVSRPASRGRASSSAQAVRGIYNPLGQVEVPALIPEGEEEEEGEEEGCMVLDDWLVDDLGKPPPKKRRQREMGDLHHTTAGSVERSASHPSLHQNVDGGRRRKRKRGGSLRREGSSRQLDASVVEIESDSDTSLQLNPEDSLRAFSDTFGSHVTVSRTFTQPPAATDAPLRVKVRIESTSYLIPCPRRTQEGMDTTVGWLASQAAERYYSKHGVRPQLSLTTGDGAQLCSSDAVAAVLQSNEEVVGIVEHWHLPPLAERYQTACRTAGAACHAAILKLFQGSGASSSILDLSARGLRPNHAPPLCQALHGQHTLSSLSLSGNRLKDDAMRHVASALAHLPTLHCLDLACIGITAQGMDSLTRPSPPSSSSSSFSLGPWCGLRRLVLSYNSLGPTAGLSLARMLRCCTALQDLQLDSCGLTSSVLDPHTGLPDALHALTGLMEVSLSFNPLGGDGVTLLLQALPPGRLARLTLNGTCSHLSQALAEPTSAVFFREAGRSLEHLDVSHCGLAAEGLATLTTCLGNCSHLQELRMAGNDITGGAGVMNLCKYLPSASALRSLDLSGNTELGNQGCCQVLRACRKTSLSCLSLAACGMVSPLPDVLVQVFSKLPLTCKLELTGNSIDGTDRLLIAVPVE